MDTAPHRLRLDDDTRHVNIQGKQYELFNIDLGEGIVRDNLALGAVIFGVWVALLAVTLRVPVLTTWGFLAYLGPPWGVTTAALHPDHGGRPQYSLWWCRVRYLARRHRSMVPPLGRAPVHRWLTRVEPLLRPPRRPVVERAFTAAGRVLILHDIPTWKATDEGVA